MAGMGRSIDTDTLTAMGRVVVEQAELRDWTLTDLAERLGWQQSRLSRWLRREAVTVSEVREIAAVLGLDAGRLVALDSRSAPATE